MFFLINSSLLTTRLLCIYSLFYESLKTASLLNSFLLLCFLCNWVPQSQGHELCLCCVSLVHGPSGGPALYGEIGYGGREWRVSGNWWKPVWNKTFICPLRSPQMPSFCLSWLSSDLCQTFWNWVNCQLWGVRYRFLCGCQAWRALNLQKEKLHQ